MRNQENTSRERRRMSFHFVHNLCIHAVSNTESHRCTDPTLTKTKVYGSLFGLGVISIAFPSYSVKLNAETLFVLKNQPRLDKIAADNLDFCRSRLQEVVISAMTSNTALRLEDCYNCNKLQTLGRVQLLKRKKWWFAGDYEKKIKSSTHVKDGISFAGTSQALKI